MVYEAVSRCLSCIPRKNDQSFKVKDLQRRSMEHREGLWNQKWEGTGPTVEQSPAKTQSAVWSDPSYIPKLTGVTSLSQYHKWIPFRNHSLLCLHADLQAHLSSRARNILWHSKWIQGKGTFTAQQSQKKLLYACFLFSTLTV